MGNYNVGQKCSGRIINVYQGNLIVELEQGFIGRVLNGAEQSSVNIGDTVDFVVKQNPDDLEELQFASYYAKDLRAFCFGFDPDAPLADSMNFTRRTLYKKLLEKYQIPFFIEEKISCRN